MSYAEIWSGEEQVATAAMPVMYSLGPVGSISRIALFYFPKINLTPIIAFEHLAGTALSKWLNGCRVIMNADGEESSVGPLRYVHGHSEAMRGKHAITTVLLADPITDKALSETQWLPLLPEIYKQFMSSYKNS